MYKNITTSSRMVLKAKKAHFFEGALEGKFTALPVKRPVNKSKGSTITPPWGLKTQ